MSVSRAASNPMLATYSRTLISRPCMRLAAGAGVPQSLRPGASCWAAGPRYRCVNMLGNLSGGFQRLWQGKSSDKDASKDAKGSSEADDNTRKQQEEFIKQMESMLELSVYSVSEHVKLVKENLARTRKELEGVMASLKKTQMTPEERKYYDSQIKDGEVKERFFERLAIIEPNLCYMDSVTQEQFDDLLVAGSNGKPIPRKDVLEHLNEYLSQRLMHEMLHYRKNWPRPPPADAERFFRLVPSEYKLKKHIRDFERKYASEFPPLEFGDDAAHVTPEILEERERLVEERSAQKREAFVGWLRERYNMKQPETVEDMVRQTDHDFNANLKLWVDDQQKKGSRNNPITEVFNKPLSDWKKGPKGPRYMGPYMDPLRLMQFPRSLTKGSVGRKRLRQLADSQSPHWFSQPLRVRSRPPTLEAADGLLPSAEVLRENSWGLSRAERLRKALAAQEEEELAVAAAVDVESGSAAAGAESVEAAVSR